MKPRYTLKVVTDFAAAHSLRDYAGECRRLHGHNWKVEVEVVAAALDRLGMAIDFKDVKAAARAAAGELDHRYLNEIPPFDQVNPTAENIAAHLFERIAETLDNERVQVSAVTVWETERACIRYAKEGTE
jgi:6-pyruvoyltetrahydropterin/6-carboxytetrahydropterin synthase